MSILYAAGFQVGGTNTMTCTVAGAAATITAGLYLPGAFDTNTLVDRAEDANWLTTDYTAFNAAVDAAFTAAASAAFTVTFSLTTGKYTISKDGGGTWTLAFSGASASDVRLRKALGFSSASYSGQNSYTSDFVAHYVLLSTIGARTYEGLPDDQEPDDIAEETVDDGGTAEVITRKTSEILATWWQTMEPRSQVYHRHQTTGGWTWEDFIKTTRGTHPFVVYDPNATELPGDGTLYRFTAKGASFRPKRVTADFSDYWNIQLLTRELGAFT